MDFSKTDVLQPVNHNLLIIGLISINLVNNFLGHIIKDQILLIFNDKEDRDLFLQLMEKDSNFSKFNFHTKDSSQRLIMQIKNPTKSHQDILDFLNKKFPKQVNSTNKKWYEKLYCC